MKNLLFILALTSFAITLSRAESANLTPMEGGANINPASQPHISNLPAELNLQLQTAITLQDSQALSDGISKVISAYQKQNPSAKVEEAVQACATQLLAAIQEGKISQKQLQVVASIMAPYAGTVPEAKSIAAQAPTAVTMQKADAMASALGQNKEPAALNDADGQTHAVIPKEGQLQPASNKEIFLIQVVQEADGRMRTGHEQSTEIEKLAEKYKGTLKVLNADGAMSLFQETFAVEVSASARQEILAGLGAIEGIEFHPLSELLSLASRRQTRPLPDAESFAAYKDRLEKGSLTERLGAFAELASALESATPEQIAALPTGTRDALAIPLYNVAGVAVNTFNMVQGSARQDIRERLRQDQAEREDGWAGVEKAAQEGLKDPAVRARFEPLRAMLVRTLGAMDRLNTPVARATIMHMLPHADYAGLEFVASNPERRSLYVRDWLDTITGSVDETIEGMRLGASRPKDWTGSGRSGGYTHVEGSRRSTHLFQWKPGRFDPAEMGNDLWLTLGMPGGASLVDWMLPALEKIQGRIPEIEVLNRENHIGQELRDLDGRIASYAEQARQAGRPYTPEQIEGIRRDLTKQIVSRYKDYDKINGQSVIDRLILSLSYRRYYSNIIPGFDEAAYVTNALNFFQGAYQRLNEPGLVKQLTDAAINFLTAIANEPVLDTRLGLRAQAIATWKTVEAKAQSMGFSLNTRLDGVIDPRPQKLLGEPILLDGAGKNSTVWQIAVSPDDRTIALAAGDRSIKIWNAQTKALLKTIQLDDARQLYGDLANSLGVAWTADGRLLVTTLHDGESDGKKFSYNLVRSFDFGGTKDVLTPSDAVSSTEIRDVYVLREMAQGPQGPFYATMKELRNERSDYLGAEVRLIGADGQALSLIENSTLLSLRGQILLTAAPGKSQPSLRLWSVSDPRHPVDATPSWLQERVAAWRERNPQSQYGWWPEISAKLGSFQGHTAMIIHDEGKLQVLDLRSGLTLRSVEVPDNWDASPYVTDEGGHYLAAVIKAPGQFSGPNPERLMIWNLSTGEILMERDATYVPQGWIYTPGQSISQLLFSRDGKRLIAAGRQSVQIFDLSMPVKTNDGPSVSQDATGNAQAQSNTPAPMDLATMESLLKGYSILNSRVVYGGGNADADLLRQLSGKDFQAKGILKAELKAGWLYKTVFVYLESEDGSKTVYLRQANFFRKGNAEKYLESLPAGKLVTADFLVWFNYRAVSTSPFYVDKIVPVDGPSILDVKERHQAELFGIAGVNGVGVGAGYIGVMFVSQEKYDAALKTGKLPQVLEGYPVRYKVVGVIRALSGSRDNAKAANNSQLSSEVSQFLAENAKIEDGGQANLAVLKFWRSHKKEPWMTRKEYVALLSGLRDWTNESPERKKAWTRENVDGMHPPANDKSDVFATMVAENMSDAGAFGPKPTVVKVSKRWFVASNIVAGLTAIGLAMRLGHASDPLFGMAIAILAMTATTAAWALGAWLWNKKVSKPSSGPAPRPSNGPVAPTKPSLLTSAQLDAFLDQYGEAIRKTPGVIGVEVGESSWTKTPLLKITIADDVSPQAARAAVEQAVPAIKSIRQVNYMDKYASA